MRSVGTCPSLALHIADVHGNSLERTFLATSPPALPVPNCCMLQLSMPSLPTPQLLPCASRGRNCSCPLLGMQILSGPWAEGPWGLRVRSCAVSPPHRLGLGTPSAEVAEFHLCGVTIVGCFGLAAELSRFSAIFKS